MDFVEDVRRFVAWATAGTSTGATAVREMCELLASLYAGHAGISGIDLDRLPGTGDRPSGRLDRVTIGRSLGARLPFQYYGVVSDPLVMPPEEPAIGDLTDDLLDVLNDLRIGIDLHDEGSPDEALGLWWYGGRTHWCQHAASALFAGQSWLARFDVVDHG